MFKHLTALVMLSSFVIAPVAAWQQQAQPIPNTKEKFISDDIFNLEYASDPQISPNGQWIVYTRNSFDIQADNTRRSLWLLNTKTAEHTPLFADQARYSNATWSPDSKRLAFTSNRQGRNQIHVYFVAQKLLRQ